MRPPSCGALCGVGCVWDPRLGHGVADPSIEVQGLASGACAGRVKRYDLVVNQDKSIWGEHFTEFKLVSSSNFVLNCYTTGFLSRPERWANVATSVLGVIDIYWGSPILHRLSIFTFGNRIKTPLFTVVRPFEFDLAVSAKDIGNRLVSSVLSCLRIQIIRIRCHFLCAQSPTCKRNSGFVTSAYCLRYLYHGDNDIYLLQGSQICNTLVVYSTEVPGEVKTPPSTAHWIIDAY
ncbi:hypothetical protein BYT27DRAFT_7199799 [Phlegmacium glaucopus]|nr:hypothetical protein BYT27DRAFT_7199799 [Phlegmacium glaucopus]